MHNSPNFKGPQTLRDKLGNGEPVCLAARTSSPGGQKARWQVADETYKMAEGFLRHLGVDIKPFLPTKAEIVAGLKNAPKVKSTSPDGKAFTNEYWVRDLPGINAFLFVSTGSGRALDSDFQQPFIQELVARVKLRKPALVFANRKDRIFRHMLASSELLLVLQGLKSFLGTSDDAPVQVTNGESITSMHDSMGAENEAARMPKKTRNGMVAHTDREMVMGRCRYASASTPPAGLIRIRLLNSKGGNGEGMLFLDEPASYPNPSEVQLGMPTVAPGEEPVNNVALVQWALTHLGKPGYDQAVVGAYLASKRFSTMGIRKHHGVSATFMPTDVSTRKHLPVRSILANLDFYESGVFKVSFGVDEVEDIEISNCFPRSGQWAAPEDFQRIRAYLAQNKGGGPASMGLIGIRVQANGGTARLTAAMKGQNKGGPSYVIKSEKNGEARVRPFLTALPHDALARSMVNGLVESAKDIWVPMESEAETSHPELHAQITNQTKEVARLHRQAKSILDQMTEVDEDGVLAFDIKTRKSLGDRHSQLLTEHVEPEEKKLTELKGKLHEEMQARSRMDNGAPLNLLHELAASLADPYDVRYNPWWKSAVQITRMEKQDLLRQRHHVMVLSWSGVIRITSLNKTFVIPFEGEYVKGGATKVDSRVKAVIEKMREGVLFEQIVTPQMRALKGEVAQALGFPSRTFNLSNCPDSRLMRIGTTVALHRSKSNEELGEILGEPACLVQRVRESIQDQPYGSRWNKRPSERRGMMFHLACQNNGIVEQSKLETLGRSDWIQDISFLRTSSGGLTDWKRLDEGRVQLRPCEHCGSRRLSPSCFYEPVGLVCLDCHMDEAGVLWPSDPYDQWLEVAPYL